MPRLRNAVTGVIVNATDETAKNLDGNIWSDADKAEEKPTARRKAASN